MILGLTLQTYCCLVCTCVHVCKLFPSDASWIRYLLETREPQGVDVGWREDGEVTGEVGEEEDLTSCWRRHLFGPARVQSESREMWAWGLRGGSSRTELPSNCIWKTVSSWWGKVAGWTGGVEGGRVLFRHITDRQGGKEWSGLKHGIQEERQVGEGGRTESENTQREDNLLDKDPSWPCGKHHFLKKS